MRIINYLKFKLRYVVIEKKVTVHGSLIIKGRKERDGELYNIWGHNERTNLEDVKTTLKELRRPESLINYVKDRPGHDLRYAMDSTKIETELVWKLEHNFDSGIRESIKWSLNNQEWLSRVDSGEYLNWMNGTI